jgi:hypothetical protein
MNGQPWRENITDAIKYWELRRPIFNAALAAIVLVYFGINYPNSKHLIGIEPILALFLLAVLANVAYCAAYPCDVFAQSSSYRETWRNYRWILFVTGLIFAGILTRYFAMAFFQGA